MPKHPVAKNINTVCSQVCGAGVARNFPKWSAPHTYWAFFRPKPAARINFPFPNFGENGSRGHNKVFPWGGVDHQPEPPSAKTKLTSPRKYGSQIISKRKDPNFSRKGPYKKKARFR